MQAVSDRVVVIPATVVPSRVLPENPNTDQHRADEPAPASGFEPGDLLVCIDDSGLNRPYYPAPPVQNGIYAVREAFVHIDGGVPVAGLLLTGISCPKTVDGDLECGFKATRFRLLHRCGGAQ